MIKYNEIKDIHAELTTLCNARCPMCARNACGFPHNFGYPETSLSLSDVKKIFPVEFIKQLTSFNVCGNFGDFVANTESADILEHIKFANPDIRIIISTNGGARDKDFWTRLAAINCEIHFCIDGLEDTHSIYRVDTSYATVIKNARTFIDAGGHALWKMIKFPHNLHQIDEARVRAKNLGFKMFELADHGRINGSLFDRAGNLIHTIGDGPHHTKIENVIQWQDRPDGDDASLKQPEKTCVTCYTQDNSSIYLAANGDIYPCCFFGFYPQTFKNGYWYLEANKQILDLIGKHNINALEVGIEHAIQWFSKISDSWQIKKYADGRTRMCDHHCGSNVYKQFAEQL